MLNGFYKSAGEPKFFAGLDPNLTRSANDGELMAELKMYGRAAKNVRDGVIYTVTNPHIVARDAFVFGSDAIEAGLHYYGGMNYNDASRARNLARVDNVVKLWDADPLTQREAILSAGTSALLFGSMQPSVVEASTVAARNAAVAARAIASKVERSPVVFSLEAGKLYSGFPIDAVKLQNPFTNPLSWSGDFVPNGYIGAGNIRLSILKERYSFLGENGLLQDKTRIMIGMSEGNKGRTVFRNRHLYDPHFVRTDGMTNLEAMLKKQRAPVGHDGKTVNVIHHFDQKHDGAWVVVPKAFHIDNKLILHSTPQPVGGVNHGRYSGERKKFWKLEAELIMSELDNSLSRPKL